jgi:DNA primase
MSLGLKAKIMHVTDGKDPDDYVRKHGKAAFQKLIDGALPGIDYEVESTLAVYNTGDLAGKVEAVSHVLPFFLDL